MPPAPIGRRRPRPVADVPALEERELARAWLVSLVAAAPLERAAELPGPGFAAAAPRLCGALLAALGSDAAFDDLEPGGALAPLVAEGATIAGAGGGADAVAALDALRTVTWSSLVAELRDPAPGLLADLADRLGAAIATLTAAAVDAPPAVAARPGDRGPLAAVLREPPEPSVVAAAPDPRPSVAGTAPEPPRSAAAPERRPSSGPPMVEDGEGFHARVAPWTAAIERRLQRHAEDGLPFAVLCVEVADLDRLVAADRDRDVAVALEAAEIAVSAQLRPADVLVRERPGRYWLVAPDTDADAARSLGHLLAAAVAAVPGHRGAPLAAAVGLAVSPEDGVDGPALEGRAEEGLFAARAAGLRVAGPLRG